MKALLVPVILGLSLSGMGIALAYLAFKKSRDEDNIFHNVSSSRQSIIEVKIPKECIGAVIGRQGSNIKDIQEKSGARLNFKDEAGDSKFRVCLIRGTPESAQLAESLIHEFIMNQPLIVSHEMRVPQAACGFIIGKGGETIRSITRASCAKVNVDSSGQESIKSAESLITIKGTSEQISIAVSLINEKVEAYLDVQKQMEKRIASKSPRKQTKETQNCLMAPQEEQLQEVTNTRKQLQLSSNGGFLDVFVSALESPSQFWVQLVNQRGVELDQLEEKMTDFYTDSTNREAYAIKEMCEGQMVAAPFANDEKWYRAKVLSIQLNEYDPGETIAELFYVDYGDAAEIKQKELCELRTEFLSLYFQAIECFLANVKPQGETWSGKAIDTFEDLAEVARWRKKQILVKHYRDDPTNKRKRSGSPVPGVELHDFDKNVNIGQELVTLGLARWDEESGNQETKPSEISPESSRTGDKQETNPLGTLLPSSKTGDKERSVVENIMKSVSSQPATPNNPGLFNGNKCSGQISSPDVAGSSQGKVNGESDSGVISKEGVTGSFTNQNGNSTSESAPVLSMRSRVARSTRSPPSFKSPTVETKPSKKKVSIESSSIPKEVVVLPEVLSDEDYYDEDDMGFSMG